MTKHGFELARGRTMFIERLVREGTPSCVVLIVGAGTASFVEQELSALVSGGGCLSPEAALRAAVLAVSIDGAVSLDGVGAGDVREANDVGQATRRCGDDLDAVAASSIPVRVLSDGAVLEASARYWVPSGNRVWLEGRRVRVQPLSPGEDHPLDGLLTSLAQNWGPRSIAVLPMTPGADGERGVGALRAAGGLALQCSDEPEEVPPHSGSRLRQHSN
jgi:hypothetical protein